MNPEKESRPSIQRLPEDVINKIAAGEVVARPANALKELLENSLDAQSTRISILVKDGGLKLLQITDDGIGIRHEDLGIVCERFTTSKLRCFEDLLSIRTYGFRGEALASMSHVSNLTITTCQRNNEAPLGYSCQYADGLPLGKPKVCAAVPGTTIVIENMFYNLPVRRKALKNLTEEYNRILDVVQKYAIHNSSVSFVCRKLGQSQADLSTVGRLLEDEEKEIEVVREHCCPKNMKTDNEIKDGDIKKDAELVRDDVTKNGLLAEWNKIRTMNVIRIIYGSSISVNDLIEVVLSSSLFEIRGFISSPNATVKKSNLILFINDRLVESNSVKRSIENIKDSVLPRNARYWMYLSFRVPTSHVDVNIHPTKKEVLLLHGDQILANLTKKIEVRAQMSLRPTPHPPASVDTKSFLNSMELNSPHQENQTSRNHSQQTPSPRVVGLFCDSGSPLLKRPSWSGETSGSSEKASSFVEGSTIEESDRAIPKEATSPMPRDDDLIKRRACNVGFYCRRVSMRAFEQKDQPRDFSRDHLAPTKGLPSSGGRTLQSSQVFRTRTDNRETKLRTFVDFRPSKRRKIGKNPPGGEQSDIGVSAKDVEAASDDDEQPDSEEPTESANSISFRAFLVLPPASSESNRGTTIRLRPSVHPLESIADEVDADSDAHHLATIADLKSEAKRHGHPQMAQMLINSSFIGAVDCDSALLQHESSLIMINLAKTFKEFDQSGYRTETFKQTPEYVSSK
ncbi:DNA mismatch repair protein Mlh1-like [Condylostylus longicornis]|uniref:DNA mismatch repair protein Mlh1-like n=1 Tax=Condylostylus longicornis TaxID=2530218 RepID=UPI00244DCA2F|nr:DNA mismatch repair protein Mlh1-like [Condylostylus longicornis]